MYYLHKDCTHELPKKTSKSSKTVTSDRIPSGAAGGPSTGRGMNYQIEYATLLALDLIVKALSSPLKNWKLSFEPRDVGLFGVTCWDLGVQPDNVQIEVKINPTRTDVEQWLETVRKGAESSDKGTFTLVFGNRGTVLITYIARLMRIAREANGDEQRFWNLVRGEKVKEADVICSLLGDNAHVKLNRIDLIDMSEGHLTDDITSRARLLCGEVGGEKLRTLLFDTFHHAIPDRRSYLIEDLISDLRNHRVQLQAPPEVTASGYGEALMPALLILQNCEGPLPTQVLAAVSGLTAPAVIDSLREAVEDGFLEFSDDLWSMRPLHSRLTLPNKTDVFSKGLETLLRYIQNHEKEEKGFRQVRNAITLARKCETAHPNAVAPVFLVLDHLLKRIGNKHLILDVAEMSISAARRADRGSAEADAEARALVCGVSWVYQRLPGHLREAQYAYDRSIELSRIFGLQESMAFSTKCLGRLHRMMAEEATGDKEEANEHLRLSIERLSEAVQLFSALVKHGPDSHEVGDCFSLLARTHMVEGQYEMANQVARKAYRILSDTASKEYIDLLILMGELQKNSNPSGAITYFTDALQVQTEFDITVREMRARAYRQRALAENMLGNQQTAVRDMKLAMEIWQKLGEADWSAQAEWELVNLEQRLGKDDIRHLQEWPVRQRVIAVSKHLDAVASQPTTALARRDRRDRHYWKKLIEGAEREDALINPEWQRLNDK
jgi:tetratricopeptide (TPR) repeat protein